MDQEKNKYIYCQTTYKAKIGPWSCEYTPQMQRLQQQQNKKLFDVHLKPKNHNITQKFTLQVKNLIFIYYEF
jgi:hypothetical protein